MSIEVQATGLDAVVSKESSCSKGYFKDPFLTHFVPDKEKRRRSPLINRGYYARFRSFELIITRFQKAFPGKRQIISLGGGSETIWFRLKAAKKQPYSYIEIDLPPVATMKANKVNTVHDLSNLIEDRKENLESIEIPFYSTEYKVVACDLTDLSKLEKILFNQCEVDPTLPTLFLSECVLVYIDPDLSGNLIEFISKTFPSSACLTYEQINPDDPFGAQMVSNLKRRGCDLKGIKAHPDLPSQEKRFLNRGWTKVNAIEMKTVYYETLSKKDRERIEKLEIFDEFEEFFLIMQHYALTLATMNEVGKLLNLDPEEGDELE